jgi:hypothetical protein
LKAVALGLAATGNLTGASYVFQVGKRYEIRMIIGGEETMSWGTIERYEHPLLKFTDVNIRSLESHLPDTTLHGEITPFCISHRRRNRSAARTLQRVTPPQRRSDAVDAGRSYGSFARHVGFGGGSREKTASRHVEAYG